MRGRDFRSPAKRSKAVASRYGRKVHRVARIAKPI